MKETEHAMPVPVFEAVKIKRGLLLSGVVKSLERTGLLHAALLGSDLVLCPQEHNTLIRTLPVLFRSATIYCALYSTVPQRTARTVRGAAVAGACKASATPTAVTAPASFRTSNTAGT
jgi:hypothetical protein